MQDHAAVMQASLPCQLATSELDVSKLAQASLPKEASWLTI
jgi:hypothetical protein